MTDMCQLNERLAGGSYGDVYSLRAPGNQVIKITKPGRTLFPSTAEIDILFRLNSPHLLKGLRLVPAGGCEGVATDAYTMERASYTLHVFTENPRILYPDRVSVCAQIALGLRCLHRAGYYHLDLTDGNVMIADAKTVLPGALGGTYLPQYRALLIDFGMVGAVFPTYADYVSSRIRITVSGRPPECFMHDPAWSQNYVYTAKTDVWSLGIIYFQIFTRRLPYTISFEATSQQFRKTHAPDDGVAIWTECVSTQAPVLFSDANRANTLRASLQGVLPPETLPLWIDLLSGMLNPNPAQRLGVEAVVNHPVLAAHKQAAERQFGQICTTNVPPLLRDPLLPITETHQKAIVQLCDYMLAIPTAPVEQLFVAVDLCMLMFVSAPDVLAVAATMWTCASIAQRIFELDDSVVSPAWRHNNGYYRAAIDATEMTVLTSRGGMLRRNFLFNSLRSVEELAIVVAMFRSLSFLQGYVTMNVPQFTIELETDVPRPAEPFRHVVRMSELLPVDLTINTAYGLAIIVEQLLSPAWADSSIKLLGYAVDAYLTWVTLYPEYVGIRLYCREAATVALDIAIRMVHPDVPENGISQREKQWAEVITRDMPLDYSVTRCANTVDWLRYYAYILGAPRDASNRWRDIDSWHEYDIAELEDLPLSILPHPA